MKRGLLYTILIALSVSACVESDIEKPATPTTPQNLVTGTGDVEDSQITSSKKTPITQAEFDDIIANTPEGQPIVIAHRSGTALTIGSPFAPPPHPDLLTFEFRDCKFESGVFVVNSFQAVMNFKNCVMNTISLETGGGVQVMEIKKSKIHELRTLDGGRCNGLTLINSKISQIQAYDAGSTPCFQSIAFQ